MIRTTNAQRAAVYRALVPNVHWHWERLWTYLVADLIDRADDQAPYLQILCGEPVKSAQHLDPWFEAQPLSPRKGGPRIDNESNTIADLALGAVRQRARKASGIEFDTASRNPWACFVEAKYLNDCDFMSTYDPVRNQLERDIESLLCFQRNGARPTDLYFTLLTPRRLQSQPRSRLYGVRMQEYLADRTRVIADIERCTIPVRTTDGQVYPDLCERVGALRLRWVTYEDILEPALGLTGIDVLCPAATPALATSMLALAASLAFLPASPPDDDAAEMDPLSRED